METQKFTQHEVQYQPSADQAERAARLRKFNLLYVYLPIGLVAAVATVTTIILLIVAIVQPSAESLLWLSGLADIALVIAMLPIIVIGAVILGLIIYSYVQARRRGMAPIKQSQTLLWRMDNVVGRLRLRTDEAASMIVQPFFRLNSALSYVKTLIAQIIGMVKRG
jgi:uncharacterized integral membrane protein